MFLLGVTQRTLIGLLGPAAVDTHQRRVCNNEAKRGAASLNRNLDSLQLVAVGVAPLPAVRFPSVLCVLR